MAIMAYRRFIKINGNVESKSNAECVITKLGYISIKNEIQITLRITETFLHWLIRLIE